jgi:murein DD-endopeptidase MepM/ murein hydrolase activator NlpD
MADSFPLLGLHDRAGGEFLAQQNIRGWCLDTVQMGLQAQALDYTALSLKGVRVIVQLAYGANGAGTLPALDQYTAFANAVVGTISNSSGVYAFVVGNEPNHPDQWPQGLQITPEMYGQLWNMIWFNVPSRVPVIPAPIDPYYGPGSDSRDYWARMLQAILRGSGGRRGGADGLMFHPKVQWHDKALVRSDQQFTDPPLLGMPYQWKAWQALYDVTPAPFKTLPIYLAMARPGLQTPNGASGWLPDNGGLIAEMVAYERENNIQHSNLVSAVIFYGWGPGPWLLNAPSHIDAIKEAAKDIATEHDQTPPRPSAFFTWPTESRVVTQSFGVNPDFYGKFKLPGHEGIDFQAPTGSKIFAAYDGVISRIDPYPVDNDENRQKQPYGYCIRERIQLDGHTYELIYAHGVIGSALVQVGQPVQAGQLLMQADSTGNALGAHLHFSMKEPGVTYVDKDENGNDRVWPYNMRDPSPFFGL